MHPDTDLLMHAILAPAAEAELWWRRWRAQIETETMSEDCVRLLPVLSPFPAWLEGDPAKNLFLGISKRAWTRNQVLLGLLLEIIAALQREGVGEAVVGGPPAWAILHQNARSFRPAAFLEFVVPRAKALAAAHILSKIGWHPLPDCVSPEGEALDHVPGIWLRKQSGERLRLMWRLFPAPPEFAADWEKLPPADTVQLRGVPLAVLRKDTLFACALIEERGGDNIDWRCDAALLLRESRMDWAAVGRYIRFAPEARTRLAALARQTGRAIPFRLQQEAGPSPLRAQWELVRGEYQSLTWTLRQPRSVLGFLRFLRQRWQAPALLMPFFGVFYVTRYACFSRSRRGQ